MRPRAEQVSSQAEPSLAKELGERHLLRLQHLPSLRPLRRLDLADDRALVGTGEENAGFLEGLAGGRYDKAPASCGSQPNRCPQISGVGPIQGVRS